MKEIYDESGILIGWRHTQEEAGCKVCRISIYSENCPHSDPGMIVWEQKCKGLASSTGPWCDSCAEQLG